MIELLVHNCLNEVLRGLALTAPVRELLRERVPIEDIERRWHAGEAMDPADWAMIARIVRVAAEDLGENEFSTRVGVTLKEARTAVEVFEQLSAPQEVWVFHGTSARLANGVFSSHEKAEKWIARNRLEGLLTRYTVDVAAYDWSVTNRFFRPSKPEHGTPEHVGRFSGGEIHFRYEAGQRVG